MGTDRRLFLPVCDIQSGGICRSPRLSYKVGPYCKALSVKDVTSIPGSFGRIGPEVANIRLGFPFWGMSRA
jgi:hypothetical protein